MNVERWGWYSIGINIILIAINLSIAIASGSLAVTAETVHNLVDLFAAVAVLIGLKLSVRKSPAFPYGLYKLENVVTVGLAFMIFFTAYEIARDALAASAEFATVRVWMLVGVAVAGAIPLVFSHFELRAGQSANSPAITAAAREYRVHGLTAGMVLAALLGQLFSVPLDRVAALLLVVVIAKTGWDLLSDGMRVLLDASIDSQTLMHVRDTILAEPAVAGLDSLTGRNAGRYRFIEGDVTLRVDDLEKAEAIIRRIEARIRETTPFVERVLLHAKPLQRTLLRYAAPLADLEGALSPHFGEAPYFGLVTVRVADGEVERQEIVANPHTALERGKGIQVAEWLVGQKPDVVLIKESLQGKGPAYVLSDAGVELLVVEADTLAEAVAQARGPG